MKIKEIEIDGFCFTDVDGLTWHSGKFWMNDKEVKKIYNNGSVALLLYGYQKKSLRKLRKTAVRCKIKIYTEPAPF